MNDHEAIAKELNLDPDKLRLSIGGGTWRYSNCINMEITKERDNIVDVIGDVRQGIPFEKEVFSEILMIHVIEHIERKWHRHVYDEIWRCLKPNGRLVLSFPDFIACAKAFIDNLHGNRWSLFNYTIYGRQDGTGDYHVTAMERQDVTTHLFHAGFVNVKYYIKSINALVTARKGEKLKEYL